MPDETPSARPEAKLADFDDELDALTNAYQSISHLTQMSRRRVVDLLYSRLAAEDSDPPF